jgi:hypothetical protein
MIRKKDDYEQDIGQNQSFAKAAAQRLAKGGELENICGHEFLEEQRQRLKNLASDNVLRSREINSFVAALQYLGNATNNAEIADNYETALAERMKHEQQAQKSMQLDMTQETYYMDICSKLGEAVAHGGDDDLEVMAGESIQNLKCPLSLTLFVDPVKNKVCGHVYSKNAIIQHLKRSKVCPLSGCTNTHVTQSQLEVDMETAQLVRRERAREAERHRQQSQSAIDADGNEDEDEEDEFE